jgi:transposase
MIFDASKIQNVYIACGYTDMRKQIDGLAAIVELQYKMHFDTESIFLFCGRKADRIKALLWDGSGYVLLYKRLAGQQFQWPRSEQELLQITPQQFRWLMEGLSITQKKVIRNTEPARMF